MAGARLSVSVTRFLRRSELFFSSRRCCSLASPCAISYSQYGEPAKVLRFLTDVDLPAVQDDLVSVRMLAAPINPADINMIQGVYPIKPPLPAVGGNEGVGEVVSVGSQVSDLHPGDWVIPADSGWGTWRTHAVCPASELRKIPNDIPLEAAATLAVNPCTAYRMLTDFQHLQPGDTIVQNGANSGVGQAVIQIAAARGLVTINVVRNRPDRASYFELEMYLKGLGGHYIITEEGLRKQDFRDIFKRLPRPKLALNCVGGKSATEILRHLETGGTMVTYGGMSRQPVTVPTGSLIFQDIKVVGYWMTQWNKRQRDSQESAAMLSTLCDYIRQGKLQAPSNVQVPISDYMAAISNTRDGFTTKKRILNMNS
ncbi:enoyl-[acyl-carrier-protein] reductase, mitochondrial-like [Branchiostoma floridae x Branchiostoma belcheri]